MDAVKAAARHHHDLIRSWQARADAADEATLSTGIIGSLFDGLVAFLKAVLDSSRHNPEFQHYQSLESDCATLLFWGFDLGVSKGDLDTRLQHSEQLRHTVLTILISIAELISQGTSLSDFSHSSSLRHSY